MEDEKKLERTHLYKLWLGTDIFAHGLTYPREMLRYVDEFVQNGKFSSKEDLETIERFKKTLEEMKLANQNLRSLARKFGGHNRIE